MSLVREIRLSVGAVWAEQNHGGMCVEMVPLKPLPSMRAFRAAPQRGLTLVELMVALAVAAILVTVAVPSMQSFGAARSSAGGADQLMQAIRLARSESLKRLAPVTLCATSDPNAASPDCGDSWKSGWLVFVDTDRDAAVGGTDIVLKVGAPPASLGGLAEDSGAASVTFEANGQAGKAMAFTVTPKVSDASRSTHTANVQHVCVSVAGRIQLKKGSGSPC